VIIASTTSVAIDQMNPRGRSRCGARASSATFAMPSIAR